MTHSWPPADAWATISAVPAWLEEAWTNHQVRAAAVAIGSVLAAWVFEVAIVRFLKRLARKTRTDIDDQVLDLLERPMYWSALLVGWHWALRLLHVSHRVELHSKSAFQTLAIIIWGIALVRGGRLALHHIAARDKPEALIQTRTVPLFDVLWKTGVIGGAIYLVMVAWRIDIGAWLASAGIVGVAVGFAARDSLANYFAGLFIIVDGPYKLNDVIILDDGTRGRVTDIGLRSTRVHTLDGIEINIPNSVLGNMQIINATAGPSPAERVTVATSVAYGTNMDDVIDLLAHAGVDLPHLAQKQAVEVAFTGFGDSGLDVVVRVWVKSPLHVQSVRHALHLKVYQLLTEAEIEIPFPQQDLYVKELPTAA